MHKLLLQGQYLLCLVLLFLLSSLSAQTKVYLDVVGQDFTPSFPTPIDFNDSEALEAYLRGWRDEQRAKAYWEASVDSLSRQDSTHFLAYLHRGPVYRWAKLSPAPNIPKKWLNRAGFRARAFNDKPLDHDRWIRIRDSLAVAAAENGFPFAQVALDSIDWISPGLLAAQISLNPGQVITFGPLEMPEAARLSTTFLSQYLGIEEGAPYNAKIISRLPARLRQLPYLLLKGNPKIRFQDGLAIVELPIERKPASRFDFVIGVLPNSNQTGNLLITGELKGELINGLGKGERIAVEFEQLRPQTQELQLAFNYPYLLDLPFGLSLSGELYRRDTQFINLNYRAAAAYLWQGNNRIEVFWSRRQTNLLGFDANRVSSLQRLPDTLDVGRSFFGLSLFRQQLDQAFNPSRGYELSLSIAAGSRRIRRNGKLLDLGLGPLYDSLTTSSSQYNISMEFDTYWPFLAGTVFYLGANAAAYLSDETLFANEQFRLGGAKLLRGFDEQQIFASSYAVLSSEFRLLLNGDAYLYAFGDFAYVNPRNQANPAVPIDYPIGFGAGVNFSTRAGIFGLSLAVGRRSGEVLDLGAPKVHFGYLSVF